MEISAAGSRETRSTEVTDQGELRIDLGRVSTTENQGSLTALVVRNRLVIALIASIVLVIVLTPIGSIAPVPNGDNSWHAALAMAFNQNVQFGPDAIFTYGPLGFLEFPQLYFTSTFAFAELFTVGAHLFFFAALLWSLSRTFARGWAIALALAGTWGVAAALLASPQGVAPASPGLIFIGGPVLIWCCGLVRDDLSARVTTVMPFLLGAGTALLFLVETNQALLVGSISVIALLLAKGRSLVSLSSFLISCAIFFVVFWIMDGQSIGNIGSYLHGSEQITSGYTAAMSVENAPAWQYLAALVLAILVGWIVYFSSPRTSFRGTWAPIILVTVFLFFTFKETFVVHGPAHKFVAFAACLVALLVVPVTASTRLPLIGALILTSVVLVAVNGFGSTLSALRSGMETSIRVPATMLSPAYRHAQMHAVSKQIHEGYYPGLALDPSTISLARGKTTYLQDGEAGVSWAYPSLDWKPLPVLQEYSAYTPYLDRLNADFIASRNGPERILRQPSSAIGSVVPAFQSPDAVISMTCHYIQLGASPSWQVLGKVSNRCGSMRQVSIVHARIGQNISVPQPTQPDEAIVARITSLPLPLATAPLSLLFKASTVNIVVNGSVTPNRFITGTAADAHLMIQPRNLGYACPFSYQPIHRFSINGGGDHSGATGVVVKFYSMPVSPEGGSSSWCGGGST